MKKYFLSLAVAIPHNYEGVVEAENEKEAIKLLIADFRGGMKLGEVNDIDGYDVIEDFNETSGKGIYTELQDEE